MKKQLVSAAIAAMFSVPAMADSHSVDRHEFFGTFAWSVNYADDEDFSANEPGVSADNNNSFIGVKGQEGHVIYGIELGLDNDGNTGTGTTDFAFVGVSDSWGALTVGRQNTPYKLAISSIDPFYDKSSISALNGDITVGFSAIESTLGQSRLVNNWTDNAIIYNSPKLGAATLSVGVYVDDSDEEDHDFSLGADFSIASNLNAGVHAIISGDSDDPGAGVVAESVNLNYAFSAYIQGDFDVMDVGLSIEALNEAIGGGDDETDLYVYLSGTVNATKNLGFRGAIGYVNAESQDADVVGLNLGVFTTVYDHLEIYSTLGYADVDDIDADALLFALGGSYAFSFSN